MKDVLYASMKKISELRKQKIEKQENIIDFLIAIAIKKDRAYIFTHPEYKLSVFEYLKFLYFFNRTKKEYPLAYLTKQKEFYNIDFIVNKYTLIPRPDTELMVDSVLNKIKAIEVDKKILLIDIGTGSGCIPIAIVKNYNNSIKNTANNLDIIATDISKQAIKIAKKNAKKHNVKINFLHGNLFQPILNNDCIQQYKYTDIIITANLPYLTKKQFKNEPSIKFEPKSALVSDDKTGLFLYEQLFKQIQKIINTNNSNFYIAIEIDPRHSTQAISLVKKYFKTLKINIKKDLSGFDRLVEFYS